MPLGRKTGGRKRGTPNKLTASLMEAAAVYTEQALQTLASVMIDEGSPAVARVGAAVALLDRGHGKPRQALELTGKDGKDLIPPDLDKVALVLLAVLRPEGKPAP